MYVWMVYYYTSDFIKYMHVHVVILYMSIQYILVRSYSILLQGVSERSELTPYTPALNITSMMMLYCL